MLRSQLYEALRSSTEGEYALVGELDADQGWMAYLAVAHSGSPAILLLHQTEDGDPFDLQVVEALHESRAVGRTRCPACGTGADGWPRFCAACRRDLPGVAAVSFRRFRDGGRLAVTQSISAGPDVEGDRATVLFTLTLRGPGRRHPATSRGVLRRAWDAWVQVLRAR